MKQCPSRLKFRKNHKVKKSFLTLSEKKNFFPTFGSFCLKSVESGKLTLKQIESGRRSIRRDVKKAGKLWIRVFTYFSVTSKPLATRMGKGKGSHSFWMCPVKAGQVIYELGGLSSFSSIRALRRAGRKLPFRTKVLGITF